MRTKKIKKIVETIRDNIYPPVFEPKKWRDFRRKNCYAYMLDVPTVSDPKKDIWIPGMISDENLEPFIFSTEDLLDRLKKDLEFLRINYRENSEELYYGEYRVAIYSQPSFHDCPIGFHFSRQDEDGTWSEKKSWKNKISKIGKKSYTPPDLSKHKLHLETVLILSKAV